MVSIGRCIVVGSDIPSFSRTRVCAVSRSGLARSNRAWPESKGGIDEMAWSRSVAHVPASGRDGGDGLRADPVDGGTRALTGVAALPPARVDLVYDALDLDRIAQHMYALMIRNVASDGFPFTDSSHTLVSKPGCVIAAPSYPADAPGISQDYVFNWVRDAAITAKEMAVATSPRPDEPTGPVEDYVAFADLCQRNAVPTTGHACFTIDGRPRPWSEQNDGPAMQTSTILAAHSRLARDVQAIANDLIARNVDFLLSVYRDQTTNLWEEHIGYSFFARSVQLRCFREITANTIGIPVPDGMAAAIGWLENALAAHWNGSIYVSMIGGPAPGDPDQPVVPDGYDPNIDIVQAAVYGAASVTDTRLLATAAQLLAHWADTGSPDVYPVNVADAALGRGPMLGRYPGDLYDGGSNSLGGHPWALCTANFAELYFMLASEIETSDVVPLDDLSAPFFTRLKVGAATSPGDVAEALRSAGKAMLQAIVYHSDHLELSEQFDAMTGYEKSVRDLTWSYAAFLSAVRALTGHPVSG
jgi:glucoamylase